MFPVHNTRPKAIDEWCWPTTNLHNAKCWKNVAKGSWSIENPFCSLDSAPILFAWSAAPSSNKFKNEKQPRRMHCRRRRPSAAPQSAWLPDISQRNFLGAKRRNQRTGGAKGQSVPFSLHTQYGEQPIPGWHRESGNRPGFSSSSTSRRTGLKQNKRTVEMKINSST